MVRSQLHRAIRLVHVRFLRKPLPRVLAIYMHALERHQYEAFSQMVAFFRNNDYEFDDVSGFLQDKGNRSRVFLSFDDNFRSWYAARDLFRDLGVRATFYINTLPLSPSCTGEDISSYFDRIHHNGERVPLGRDHIRALRSDGHLIGCHGHSHRNLARLERAAWPGEIEMSKRLLEAALGEPVQDFSFPYGMRRHFNRELANYCIGLGFRSICSARPGLQHCTRIDAHQIHRTLWKLDADIQTNLDSLRVDGRLFQGLTGFSPVG